MREHNTGEVVPFDWTIEPAHKPELSLFERAWVHGRHTRVAVDFNHDFPTLIETAVSVAAYTDDHGDTVYVVGVDVDSDDETASYTDEALAWEAAVELACALATDTPWDVAWDEAVPARKHLVDVGSLAA